MLGEWNQVPDRPGYIYGLAMRNAFGVTVEIFRDLGGELVGKVRARGWSDEFLPGAGPGIHTKARKLIDDYEGAK